MHQGQPVGRSPAGQVEGEAHAALDAVAGVDRALGGDLVWCPLAQETALARVRALGVLADDDEVGTLGDGTRHAREGSEVDVEVELEAEAQQHAAFEGAGRDGGVTHRWPDRAEQDGVEAPELVQRLVGEDGAVAQVPGGAQIEGRGVEVHPGGGDHLEGLGADLRPDAVPADDGDPMPSRCGHCSHCSVFSVSCVCRVPLPACLVRVLVPVELARLRAHEPLPHRSACRSHRGPALAGKLKNRPRSGRFYGARVSCAPSR